MKQNSTISYDIFDNYHRIIYLPKDIHWEIYELLSSVAMRGSAISNRTNNKSASAYAKTMVDMGLLEKKGKKPSYFGIAKKYRGLSDEVFTETFTKLKQELEERRAQRKRGLITGANEGRPLNS
jgi:hypothetical protein